MRACAWALHVLCWGGGGEQYPPQQWRGWHMPQATRCDRENTCCRPRGAHWLRSRVTTILVGLVGVVSVQPPQRARTFDAMHGLQRVLATTTRFSRALSMANDVSLRDQEGQPSACAASLRVGSAPRRSSMLSVGRSFRLFGGRELDPTRRVQLMAN